MIDKRLVPVNGLKKEPFSGCHHGMRYYFLCDDSKESFTAFVYPEPWCFEQLPMRKRLLHPSLFLKKAWMMQFPGYLNNMNQIKQNGMQPIMTACTL